MGPPFSRYTYASPLNPSSDQPHAGRAIDIYISCVLGMFYIHLVFFVPIARGPSPDQLRPASIRPIIRFMTAVPVGASSTGMDRRRSSLGLIQVRASPPPQDTAGFVVHLPC